MPVYLQPKKFTSENLLKNGNFINNSTNGYGGVADDWTNSSGNPVQGGFPSMTKAELIALLGIADGDIEGLWNLNEASGNATDLSSNAYHLTETGGTIAADADGLMGTARDFELGDTEYFTIADASCANLRLTGNRTCFAFVKPESIPTGSANSSIMAKRGESNTYRGWEIIHIGVDGSNGTIEFQITGLTTATALRSDVKMEAGKWYFVACIYDGSLLKVWVNGVKKETAATGSGTDSGVPFDIGCTHTAAGNTPGGYWDGLIQCAGVLSVALTDAQVKRLWAATTYKGQKIRRATDDATYYQSLEQDLVERLRGKVITLRANGYCSSTNHGIYITTDGTGGTTTSDTPSSANAWETLSAIVTVPADATSITVGIKAPTTDGNAWFKELMLTEGSASYSYVPSADDWSRFPRLLKMDIPAWGSSQKPYQYEENRYYSFVPTWVVATGLDNASGGQPATSDAYWKYNKDSLNFFLKVTGTKASTTDYYNFTGLVAPADTTSNMPYGVASVHTTVWLMGFVQYQADFRATWTANINDNTTIDHGGMEATYRF